MPSRGRRFVLIATRNVINPFVHLSSITFETHLLLHA
jgi:hypothetical protein